MTKPQEVFCDFCKNEIKTGQHYVKLEVPLPPSLRQELIAHVEQTVGERFKGSPITAINGGVGHMVPALWALLSCVPCMFAILPGLKEAIAAGVRQKIGLEVEFNKRSQQSQADLEEAAS